MPVLQVWFYNLRVGRPRDRVYGEIRALLRGADILGLVEALDYGHLPAAPGKKKVRDESSRSRANVAAYVAKSLPLHQVTWDDQEESFPRNKHPDKGAHEPRSTLYLQVGHAQVVVHHHPPEWPGAGPARAESVASLRHRMAPWTREDWDARGEESRQRARARSRLLVMDANGAQTDIARALDGMLHGDRIDCGVTHGHGVEVLDVEYTRTAPDGTALGTDHPWGALHLAVRVPDEALR